MSATSTADRPAGIVFFRPVAVSFGLLVLAAALAVLFGTERTSALRALGDPASLDRVILLRARIPRVALAAAAGAGLSVVGAALQSMLKNPLAEPYLLGVSGGAALGATLALLLGLSSLTLLGAALVPAAALAGGFGATLLVYAVARSRGSPSGTEILLSGIIVNAMAGSVVTFAKLFATPGKNQELLFWLMGFVDVPSGAALALVAAYVTLGSFGLFLDAAKLNLLSLGEQAASHLGLDVSRLTRRVFFASSLVVGAVVSVTGLIGFVGLVVPHAARRVIGPDLRVLMPVCFFAGAAALVLSDLLARASFVWLGTEPPVGAITALVGGPLALLILKRR